MGNTTPQLQYSPERLPWYRWKRVQRAAIWFAIALAIAIFAFWWAPTLWRQAEAVYWRHQCMTYAAPTDQVVFDLNGDRATLLLKSGQGYDAWSGSSKPPVAAMPVRAWREYMQWDWPMAVPVLFLHGCVSKGGQERLVAVIAGPVFTQSGTALHLHIQGYVEKANPEWTARLGPPTPAHIRNQVFNLRFEGGTKTRDLRFFAGQPDPQDESHFTIRYEMSGQAGVIDGWLRTDDEVLLEVRDGPAATMPVPDWMLP